MVALIGRKIPTTGVQGYQAGGLGDVFDRLASTLADPLTPAIKREKLTEMNRQNIGTESLANMFGGGDVDPAAAAATAIRAGIDPRALGGYNVFSVTNRRGPESPEAFTAAMAVPGADFMNTIRGRREEMTNRLDLQRAQEATKLAVAGQTPEQVLGPDGTPIIVRRSEAYGQRPVLPLTQEQGAYAARTAQQPGGFAGATPFERAFVGAEPKAGELYQSDKGPVVWTGEGFKDPNTLAPVQGVTTVGKLQATDAGAFGKGDPIQKSLIEAEIGTQTALAAIDRVGASLMQPNAGAAVGWLGTGARWFNDVRAQLDAASKLVGSPSLDDQLGAPEIRNGLDRTMARLPPAVVAQAQQLGIDNVVLRSRITDLAYMIARAQNPVGVVSEPDFERAAQTVGGALFDPKAMTTVLEDVKKSLVQSFEIRKQVYEKYRGAAPAGTIAPTTAPAAPTTDPMALKQKYGLE